MKAGFRIITTQWRIKGLADMSRLSNEVLDFCRGTHIYVVEKQMQDKAEVVKGKNIYLRKKRVACAYGVIISQSCMGGFHYYNYIINTQDASLSISFTI